MSGLMTQKDIISLPHVHLRQPSRKIGIVTPDVKKIIHQMEEATMDWDHHHEHEVGVALAAVQIDRMYKIVIVRNSFDKEGDSSFTAFINPIVTKYDGEIIEDYEGCLSVKNIYGKVPRYSKVKIKAIGVDGKEFRVTAEGFLARVFQHEIDHTNGKVFIDHIRHKSENFFRLMPDGKLKQLNYEKDIKNNKNLWE